MVKIAYKYTKADKTVIKDTQIIGNMEIVKHFVVAGCGQVLSQKHLKKAKAALTYFEDFFLIILIREDLFSLQVIFMTLQQKRNFLT